MTGDSEHTAKAVAKAVGVDAYYSEVLPEDKAAFVQKEKEAGNKVVMIGDGINRNYRLIVAINGSLIGLGVAGVIQPATSALLHNTSTLMIGLESMRNLLPEE